mmetsp:Transcript_11820/g.34705  ORF Transcript_11820/g.34705 Transcript_11820/m.34705 type:complete len:85 (-) Transcript_11820:1027-1281(-)
MSCVSTCMFKNGVLLFAEGASQIMLISTSFDWEKIVHLNDIPDHCMSCVTFRSSAVLTRRAARPPRRSKAEAASHFPISPDYIS